MIIYHREQRAETTHQSQLDIQFGQLKCVFMVVFVSVIYHIDRQSDWETDRQTNRRMCTVSTTKTDPEKEYALRLAILYVYVRWCVLYGRELIKKNHSMSQCCCFSWCLCRLWDASVEPIVNLYFLAYVNHIQIIDSLGSFI